MKRIGEWLRARKGQDKKLEGARGDPRVTSGSTGLAEAMRIWGTVTLVLSSTGIVIVTLNVPVQEWVTAIVFIIAHLVAADVVLDHRK